MRDMVLEIGPTDNMLVTVFVVGFSGEGVGYGPEVFFRPRKPDCPLLIIHGVPHGDCFQLYPSSQVLNTANSSSQVSRERKMKLLPRAVL